MSSPIDHPLNIQVSLPSDHPQLLAGLDHWLSLGLISDAQVKYLCRQYLVCAVVFAPQAELEQQVAMTTPTFVGRQLIASLPPEPRPPAKPNFVTSMLQSLGEELSVRWLLFLGIFLVVVSSGVLAASQWERFPAVGQYGVLLAYTLSFCGFTFWAGKQSNLRLTAQTLLIATLLLVPVNFWAMDSLKLWQNPINWVVMAFAAVLLSTMTILLCCDRTIINNFPSGKLPLVNILGLSYLHWGWNLAGFPLIAVYLAMVGTTIITVYQNPQQNQGEQRFSGSFGLYSYVIIYALVSLLTRAIFLTDVNITQLGLAIGICGGLVMWLSEKNLTPNSQAEKKKRKTTEATSPPELTLLWEKLGEILLFLGWLMSVWTQPAQAVVVSGISLWVCSRRLQRCSFKVDVAAIFLIGLQTTWLIWRLVPDQLQQLAINTATYLTHSQNQPWALLSIALFPYIILMLVLTDRLYRDQKQELATFGEQLTLLLGVCLTMFALLNPILLTLNLLSSTITLALVTKRHSFLPFLVYLTHITGILTLFSTINWLSPNLNQEIWAAILLTVMVAEWVFSLGAGIWKRSAWYIGLGLAAFSFALLFVNLQSSTYGVIYNYNNYNRWGVIWLITPIALTGLGIRTTEQRRIINAYLSILAVIVAQFLTLLLPETRLIGLGVGIGVMFVNTSYLRKEETAGLTIGFGLGFIAALLWSFPNLAVSTCLIVGAISTLSLWLGRTGLLRKGTELAVIYAAASDKWAIALTILELLGITVHSFLIYSGNTIAGIPYLIATAITLTAIIYRSWQQPTNWAFYGIGWCLELLTAEILGFGEHSIIKIGIANIALGLTTQLFGEWWRRKYQSTNLPSSFHILPLIYGAFSVLLRLTTFTDWTGLYSLGVALILIGVGRRREEFKPLLYFGIIGVSISAYELLFYQMSQASGGALGDGLIAMSALGATIMYAYRILSPWLISYLRLTPGELKNIAHLHWVWSSCLFLAAITVPIQINLSVGIGTGIFLMRYAIWQGRKNTLNIPVQRYWGVEIDEIWVYLGLIEAAIVNIYLQQLPVLSFIGKLLLPWRGALACIVAYFLYIIPWENWGWSKTPWQRAAYILPLFIIWQTQQQIYPITLVLCAGFYIFLAIVTSQLRFTYLSVALIDWALFREFNHLGLTDSLWYVTPIGLSFLYIAQIDQQLRLPESKSIRHSLRMLSSILICGWPVFFHQNLPLIPGIFSLIAIFAGLALRVRAFLYVGTAAFLITSIYQLVIFSLSYSFLKWIVGLLVGILLIYIAANFETRRTQINILIRNTINEFENWE
ncbi:DUF2157 domain-containing protein [Anabaena cylindrica FACHB-243]|uniref:DUF2157 domain-containing protein n=1 Tax=Anabaena cylindrica (strain ATCC 27899 / PCC 7122) TaxID=272123 RepID=K9ZDN7_ANACC|nr:MULTISPECIES: hypothetical protein [Anabaena]AFZ56687.1 hypothetical protein Anacy_1123 [Anabaena cylindrica PCC 7122]MBD2419433.1 DUF2157 domain-containing protein [Anabaena cylindrica FACHB-243]MBY5283868.1 DUF2157 domain-containing protein [Anabaena sp. CCAP 1446/1C]MBY5308794.1 DUF2157 domain-containing protein [Anabaena sp. CCAP 1446/1C]MCM2408944.1 DUF2157 domain-containing protein [Anabaena sp. CCAP 1446/1C]